MHRFQDFKGFADARIDLMRPVTLLIGRNGAGKSNVIEGVELLANLAHGMPLSSISDVGRGAPGSFELRGGLDGCVRRSAAGRGLSLGFQAKFLFDGSTQLFEYVIEVDPTGGGRVSTERLSVGDRLIFSAAGGGSPEIVDVTFDNFARGGIKPTTHLAADRSVLSRYASFAPLPQQKRPRIKDAHTLVRAIELHLNAAFVFDPHPRAMRGYARIGQTALARDGSNLSAVLYSLFAGDDKSREILNRIKNRIQQVPEEPFVDFDFVTTRLNDVMLALKTSAGDSVDARQLSDGTLRALAVLTAIETVPEVSRIVVEEVDNGIHSSRLDGLVDALWETASRRRLNVLMTTHNPATLDCLDAQQLQSVTIAYLNPTNNCSELIRLVDLPRAETIIEPGLLGGLVTKQTLDRFLGPDAKGDQQARMKAWLESLG